MSYKIVVTARACPVESTSRVPEGWARCVAPDGAAVFACGPCWEVGSAAMNRATIDAVESAAAPKKLSKQPGDSRGWEPK